MKIIRSWLPPQRFLLMHLCELWATGLVGSGADLGGGVLGHLGVLVGTSVERMAWNRKASE